MFFRKTVVRVGPIHACSIPMRRFTSRGVGFNPKAVASFTSHANHLARSRGQEFKRGVRIRS